MGAGLGRGSISTSERLRRGHVPLIEQTAPWERQETCARRQAACCFSKTEERCGAPLWCSILRGATPSYCPPQLELISTHQWPASAGPEICEELTRWLSGCPVVQKRRSSTRGRRPAQADGASRSTLRFTAAAPKRPAPRAHEGRAPSTPSAAGWWEHAGASQQQRRCVERVERNSGRQPAAPEVITAAKSCRALNLFALLCSARRAANQQQRTDGAPFTAASRAQHWARRRGGRSLFAAAMASGGGGAACCDAHLPQQPQSRYARARGGRVAGCTLS